MTDIAEQLRLSKRCPQYLQGRREAIKWAITWLHARAETMNDPNAKAILNVAGTDMGFDTSSGQIPNIKRENRDRHAELSTLTAGKRETPLTKRPATWTWCPDARAYYFAPDAARPPYYTTREVKAIIDIADDGTLAGVEIIEFEGPPLPAPPFTDSGAK